MYILQPITMPDYSRYFSLAGVSALVQVLYHAALITLSLVIPTRWHTLPHLYCPLNLPFSLFHIKPP